MPQDTIDLSAFFLVHTVPYKIHDNIFPYLSKFLHDEMPPTIFTVYITEVPALQRIFLR